MAWDAAVIGAGVFGAWTAWHLRRAGASVLLVDAWNPGHSRASSGGETRVIRMSYGADEIYTRMSMRSLALWRELFERTGQPLFHRTGVLFLGRDDHPYIVSTRQTLLRCGVPMEWLSGGDLANRYPQMRIADPRVSAVWEPSSGVLMARRAVAAVVADAIAGGVVFETRPIASPRQIAAGAVVFSCGPWLPKIFPELLGQRIFPTRQEVFFFAPPAGSREFSPERMPAWVDFPDPRGPYGVPDIESRGFKVAFDRHGAEFDPDTGDRRIGDQGLAEARRFLAERFPALRDAPLVESRVCQYANTSSGDFLLDRHPGFENVWLAGGGSGHGFKQGPAVGEYLAGRILRGGEPEPRFSLASKQETQQRAVY
jgi:sarcosine oxidase